jgi:hypothetical protein
MTGIVDVGIDAGDVAAVRGWWQYYPLGDPAGERTGVIQLLEQAGALSAPVHIRGTVEEVRALAAALVEVVALVEAVEGHERVNVLVAPANADAVDP